MITPGLLAERPGVSFSQVKKSSEMKLNEKAKMAFSGLSESGFVSLAMLSLAKEAEGGTDRRKIAPGLTLWRRKFWDRPFGFVISGRNHRALVS